MAIRKDVQAGDGPRTVTLVEADDQPVVVREHAEAVAHTAEVRTTHADGFVLARAWMRTFTMFTGFLLLILESLLAFRLAFQLGGAHATNGFVSFIYDVSHPFQAPFAGIANHSTSASGNSVFEPETVIAMAVWAAVTILLVVFVNVLTSAPASTERDAVSRDRYASIDKRS